MIPRISAGPVQRDNGITDAGYKDANSSGDKARPDDSGDQCCSHSLLIAKLAQLFFGATERVSRKRNCFTRIVGEASSEAINGGIITSN